MVDYLEEVKKLIANQFGIPENSIEEEQTLEADLGISDLDLEDFLSQLESKYHLEIPPEVYNKFETVADIANYLYENLEQV